MTSQGFAANLRGVAADPKDFGAWLQGERKRLGLSRDQVNKRGGPSIATQQNYEEGGRMMDGRWKAASHTPAQLERLASALGLDPEEVFGRADVPMPEWVRRDKNPTGLPASLHGKLDRLTPEQRAKVDAYIDGLIEGGS